MSGSVGQNVSVSTQECASRWRKGRGARADLEVPLRQPRLVGDDREKERGSERRKEQRSGGDSRDDNGNGKGADRDNVGKVQRAVDKRGGQAVQVVASLSVHSL